MMRGWSVEAGALSQQPLRLTAAIPLSRHDTLVTSPLQPPRTASSSKSPVYPADRPTRKLPRNGRTLLTRWLPARNLSTSCTAVAGTAPLLSLPCYTPD